MDVKPFGRLRLFALYADFAAAVRARRIVSRITQLAGEEWKAGSEMWKLECLRASPAIRTMMTREAADADVLIAAISSLDRREDELVAWLDAVAAVSGRRASPGLFIGLLGDEDGRAAELDWTVKQFLRCARQMDRDFIWHWMEPPILDDDEWLATSVETLMGRKMSARDAAFPPEPILATI